MMLEGSTGTDAAVVFRKGASGPGPGLAGGAPAGFDLASLREAAPGIEQDLPVPITRAMHLIWLLRADLISGFDLATRAGRLRFLLWCLRSGSREYHPEVLGIETMSDRLREPAADPALAGAGMSRIMALLWESREDLRQAYPLDTPPGRAGFLLWWAGAAAEVPAGLHRLAPWQRQLLLSPDPGLPVLARAPVLRLHRLIYDARPDLQAVFDLTRADGQWELMRWYLYHGAAETGAGALLAEEPPTAPPAPPVSRCGPERAAAPAPVGRVRARPRPADAAPDWGVNLIGHAYGELGIAEDLRMMVRACRAAGIPFAVIDFPPGEEVSQGDRQLAPYLRRDAPFPVNVFCLTAFETVRFWGERGPDLFEGRLNVGCWPWELPRWPEPWADAFRLVDEVWAPSRYCSKAYLANAPVPVHHMPPAVELGAVAGLGRADFGLPQGAYLFYSAFDCNSRLARKNPDAVVAAFRDAFAPGDHSVGLVMKLMNPGCGDPDLDRLRAAMAGDGRIRVIERTLPQAEINALYAACDCCISLHRAEGFGRVPAEALLLAKPVIATDFSGSRDFCRPDTAFPIGHGPAPVGAEAYPWGAGQTWADPIHGEVVAAMRLLVRDPALGRRQGERGQALMRRRFSPAAAGARYRARLRELAPLARASA